jgi:hypothetical protein
MPCLHQDPASHKEKKKSISILDRVVEKKKIVLSVYLALPLHSQDEVKRRRE